ncbi:MAG: sugar phosphate isomerase/epimerase [Planctomycetota bacterium]|nr:sugar phosphate isomerase/epimerase [Planctomycetota bacterium]
MGIGEADISITTDFHDDGGPIEPRLAMFAEAGFTHIHWCEHWSRDFLYEDFYTAGVGRLLDSYGLKLLDTHGAQTASASPAVADETVRRRGVRLLENRIRFTRMLGGDCVVIHPPPGDAADPAKRGELWAGLARSIEQVARICEDSKVRLALENAAAPRPPEFDALFRSFPPDLLGFCFDSGHANISGESDLVEIFGNRLAALHLHDNCGTRDEHALPGDGTVSWGRVISALRAARYRKPVNLEVGIANSGLYDGVAPADFVREAFRKATELIRSSGAPPF